MKSSKSNKANAKEDQIRMDSTEIDFQEPSDYSIEEPEVIIEGCTYSLFEGGSLSYVTPKLLAELIEN
ncbi:MAG: hypothetical protein KGI19_09910 [Thaumarchaeota archaeon]|nr:hypothetical protein [Nitrososphaerota archaeon]